MLTPTNAKIVCDTCHDEYIFVPLTIEAAHGLRLATEADVLVHLESRGWRVVGGRHVCPECWNMDVT